MKRFDPDHVRGVVPGHVAATSSNGVLFVAGQVGFDRDLKVVGGGLLAQTEQALVNLREVLEVAGLDPSALAQLSLFYKYEDDLVVADALREFVEIKERILPGSIPVGFACTVQGLLLPELLIEVQAVAFTEV